VHKTNNLDAKAQRMKGSKETGFSFSFFASLRLCVEKFRFVHLGENI
jgi:hypothetical protein